MPKKVIEDDLVSESSYGDMPLEEPSYISFTIFTISADETNVAECLLKILRHECLLKILWYDKPWEDDNFSERRFSSQTSSSRVNSSSSDGKSLLIISFRL